MKIYDINNRNEDIKFADLEKKNLSELRDSFSNIAVKDFISELYSQEMSRRASAATISAARVAKISAVISAIAVVVAALVFVFGSNGIIKPPQSSAPTPLPLQTSPP